MFTLIFKDRSFEADSDDSEEEDYTSKNYLAQVFIVKNLETNESKLTAEEIVNDAN